MLEFFTEQNIISPLIGLVGLIIGVILTFIFSSSLKHKETKLKISEKLIDKRLDAHEQVLKLAKLMRSSHSQNEFNSEKELITYPIIFFTEENYRDWRKNFFFVTNDFSHWLSTDVLHELFYIQDYIVNLDKMLENVHKENLLLISFKDSSIYFQKKTPLLTRLKSC